MLRKHLLTDNGRVMLAEDISTEEVEELALTLFRELGGRAFFQRLALRFYNLVMDDPLMSPMFVGDARIHAERLASHFERMYGRPDLSEGWDVQFVRAHTKAVISNERRLRWLELMRQAGADVEAPEPWFSDLLGTLTNASGVVVGISRGAALARGEEFDRSGRPATSAAPPTP